MQGTLRPGEFSDQIQRQNRGDATNLVGYLTIFFGIRRLNLGGGKLRPEEKAPSTMAGLEGCSKGHFAAL